jgi:nitrate reductase gamma subunit
MDFLLVIAIYVVYGAFILRVLLHALQWLRATAGPPIALPGESMGANTCCRVAADLFFFTRLLRSNGTLWVLEWFFHVSLLLELLRHLRYVLNPVPSWVWTLQPLGLVAGYILPAVTGMILFIRLATRHELYSSPLNLRLLGALFIVSITGVLMHAVWKPDLIGIKEFCMGVATFAPAPWPGGLLSTIHLLVVLAVIPFLPTHIFSAPVTIAEAARREEALREVLHGR